MKIRPISANPSKKTSKSTSMTTPIHSAKNDLKVLMSSQGSVTFFDSQIFKLTEAKAPDFKSITSTQIFQELNLLKNSTNLTNYWKTAANWKIERLSLELSQAESAEIYFKKIPRLKEKIEELDTKIKDVKLKQNEKLEDREVYHHISKRMVQTKIFLEIKFNSLQEKLNVEQHYLNIEKGTFLKSRESRCRSARVYKSIDLSTQFYNKNKSKIKEKIDKDQEILDNLEADRYKRQQRYRDIKKQVDDEETIRKFKGIREGIMLHRSWFMVLTKKLNENILQFGTIELAFRKIRGIIGLYDINDVVEKFLTKENGYIELMKTIVQNKLTKENLIQRNNELESKIQKITISERPAITSNKLRELTDQILNFTNRNIYDKKRQEIMNGIKINIRDWIKRNIKSFQSFDNNQSNSLRELIVILKNIIIAKLKTLENKPEGSIMKKAMNVFEYKTPNKISFASKMKVFQADFNDIASLSELNQIEYEANDHFKRPLLEKSVKKKH